ncbi:MAG: PD-(D/E)XK nuclease family protein [Chloroflexi bacterium]|nr:PD-(D/E)XK nuclease family protein [Chloroflexota bacterium]
MITTYSMWNLFRNCRKAWEWRYLRELVPLNRERPFAFGALIHSCLEMWHGGGSLDAVLEFIDAALPSRIRDESQKSDWHLARAMMTGYAARYPLESFEIVALGETFEGRIVNPSSRRLSVAGKVDGIVKIGRDYYILEHKTTSQLDTDYLDRLWTDWQLSLYAHYIEQTLGVRVAGVIYNVLVKARLKPGKGESQAEFESRRADLLAKSKTGKTTATRKTPESDDAFAARLAAKYLEPDMFYRETLYISRDQLDAMRADLWELTQQFLHSTRRGVFCRNTSYCLANHRTCPYFPLCRSNGSENVIANLYEHCPPHHAQHIQSLSPDGRSRRQAPRRGRSRPVRFVEAYGAGRSPVQSNNTKPIKEATR